MDLVAPRTRLTFFLRFTSGLSAAVMLVALMLVHAPGRASAFVIWCWDDPIVEINRQVYQIEIGVQGDEQDVRRNVKSATTVITVPKSAKYRLLKTTNKYFHERVVWQEDKGTNDVTVSVTFVTSEHYPAALRVNGTVVTIGTTSSPLTTSFPAR